MGSSSMDSKASAIVRPGAVRQAQHMLVEGRGSTQLTTSGDGVASGFRFRRALGPSNMSREK